MEPRKMFNFMYQTMKYILLQGISLCFYDVQELIHS